MILNWLGKNGETDFGPVWRPFLIVVATCWIIACILTLLGIVGMYRMTGLVRLAPISHVGSPNTYNSLIRVESDREYFRQELASVIANLATPEAKTLAILQWVMNEIPRVENRYIKSSRQMVETGRAGGGLICGGMAQIFRDALIANGIPARRLYLQRNLFDSYDTHVTVEAFIEGKWRLYDPTFHITLKANDQHIGAEEARRWFLNRKGENVEIEFLGEVRYPARYMSYPIRYEVLFNNINYEIQRSYTFDHQTSIGKLINKVMGFWQPLGYQNSEPGLSTRAQDFYRVLYYITLVVLPVINLILLVVMWSLWKKVRQLSHSAPSSSVT